MAPARRTAAALLAVVLAAAGPAPAQEREGAGSAPAADAPVRLSLEIAPVEKEVALGERIEFRVTLRNESEARAVPVHPLRLGSPDSLSFTVKEEGRVHQVAKLFGTWEGNRFQPATVPWHSLKAGERMDQAIDLLALLPGRLEIAAAYRGVQPRDRAEPLHSRPVVVTVKPGPKGEKRIGARIRTDKGVMRAALEPRKAWNTVHNFLTLAEQGSYDGLDFHRIVEGFMVQTGDPQGNGTGGPGYWVPAEPNNIKHEKGVLSMARGPTLHSAGSQFFVMHGANASLDWNYTAFGRLVEGTGTLDALATVPTRFVGAGTSRERSDPVVRPRLLGVDKVLLPGKE